MNADPALTIEARPEPLSLTPERTAVVVVDLQNGYASPGGYRDLAGRDISGAPKVIENTLRILAAARPAGMTVVFLQNGWDPELREAVLSCMAKARAANKLSGIFTLPGPLLSAAMKAGCDLVVCGGDVMDLGAAWTKLLSEIPAQRR